jgi:hypothetical protein
VLGLESLQLLCSRAHDVIGRRDELLLSKFMLATTCEGCMFGAGMRHLLLAIQLRLQNLTVVVEALRVLLFSHLLWRWRGLDLCVGVAGAENVGRHYFD